MYRAGGTFIWMHEYFISRSLRTLSALDVRRLFLLADEVDAFYISLSGQMDVHKEGVGKVQQHSDIA